MDDVLHVGSALGVLALLAHKYRALRRAPRDRRPALLPICLSCVTAAPAFLFLAPSIGTGFDRLTGVPNLSVMVVYGCGVAFVVANQAMLLYWRHPPAPAWRATRRVLVACALVFATMVVLFALGETPEERHGDFPVAYADAPHIGELLVLYHATFLVGLLNVVRLCRRWAEETPDDQPWLRRGLRLNAVGVLIGSCYAAMVLVAVLGSRAGADLDAWGVAAPKALTLAVPVVVVGASIAAWGPRLPHARDRLVRALDALRDHRSLHPLWSALRAVDPAMRHTPGSLRERLSPEHRLFWRVIEINDWLHRLRARRDPDLAAAVERHGRSLGLTDDEIRAAAEAARIRAALRARARGAVPADAPDADQDLPLEPQHAFAGERARLVRVARAFTSPVVDAALSTEEHPCRRDSSPTPWS